MKHLLTAAVLTFCAATAGQAAPEKFTLDPSHSQILFSYDHLGYSTTWNMFSGFNGDILFDQEDPAASSVTVSIPLRSMFTGWEARFEHFMGDEFFAAADDEMIGFQSTGIEVTGETTARITGDLTLNGVTKPVVLDAVLNKRAPNPMSGKDSLGFNATTTLVRSEFGLGQAAPYVGDEVSVTISIEAAKAD